MNRTLSVVMAVVCLSLSGCEAMAEYQAQQEAQRQAMIDNLKARIAQLTPEQRDAVQHCYSTAVGKINTLRNAGQGGATNGMNDFTVTDACINNPYFAETIPAPSTNVIVNAPQRNDGGLTLYQQCLAAQAAGAGACP
jgi:hypothetical protein